MGRRDFLAGTVAALDWAHKKRYDQVLGSLQYFDSALKTPWNFVQSW